MKLNYVSATLVEFHQQVLLFEEQYDFEEEVEKDRLIFRLTFEEAQSLEGELYDALMNNECATFTMSNCDWMRHEMSYPDIACVEFFALLNQWQAKREEE